MIESAWEKMQEKFQDIICNNKRYYDIVRIFYYLPIIYWYIVHMVFQLI